MKSLFLTMLLAPAAVLAAANSPDESFYKTAAEAGISEVSLGKLAQDKSPSKEIMDFGAMMVKDHSAANEKLQALAASKNITLPTSASVGEMATKAKLEVLKGDTFDKSYIKSQVKAHEDTLKLLNKEIASGQDSDAQAFAKSVRPTVQGHLKAIRAIAAAQNVKTS
jgi:putative membrane protein